MEIKFEFFEGKPYYTLKFKKLRYSLFNDLSYKYSIGKFNSFTGWYKDHYLEQLVIRKEFFDRFKKELNGILL